MVRSAAIVGLACLAGAAAAQIEHLPRHLTDLERDLIAREPLTPERATDVPTGPLWCPPEYAPAEAISMELVNRYLLIKRQDLI